MVAEAAERIESGTQLMIRAPADERQLLADVARVLDSERACDATLTGPDGEAVALPASLREILRRGAQALAQGEAVAIASLPKQLTTNEAADLLNVSRPYLVQLLERGDIPFTKVGTHRRIAFGDLLVYKAQRDAKRHAALVQLAQLSEEYGLYDRT